MAATRVVMHQIVLPSEVDSLGICFGGQVRAHPSSFLWCRHESRQITTADRDAPPPVPEGERRPAGLSCGRATSEHSYNCALFFHDV